MNGKSERQIEKCSSPTGDGNFKADVDNAITVNKELRNVVPRQGTEIRQGKTYTMVTLIEKCSSPTGDGNLPFFNNEGIQMIEKCSSPTRDGNFNA